jgi:hypothetical protein
MNSNPTPKAEDLARLRADATGEAYMQWLDALEEGLVLAQVSRLVGTQFATLANACSSPAQFSLMIEAFHEHRKENPSGHSGYQLLVDQVDDSAFSLSEWVEACERIYSWLANNDRSAPLETILGYLRCSAEYVSTTFPHENLGEIVSEMLDNFGFDG